MFYFLRILFCVLAVLCVAAVFPVAIFLGWTYCIACIGAAVIFGCLMIFFKNKDTLPTQNLNAPDFMNSPEENERLLQAQNVSMEEENKE